MPLKIEIRRNSDGVISNYIESDIEFNEFIWTEGNFACDCNRELFFIRGRNEEEPEDPQEIECGNERYSVRITDFNTSKILYDEMPNLQTLKNT